MLALQLDGAVRQIINADAVLVAPANAVQLFAKGAVVKIVEIEAAYHVTPSLLGEFVSIHGEGELFREYLILPVGDVILQLMPEGRGFFYSHLPNTSCMYESDKPSSAFKSANMPLGRSLA